MPKKRSIKTSSPSDFEPKRKNPISLGSDSNIDKDFKPLKIGGKSTGLEFADGKILSSAEEFVTLKEKTQELQVSIIKGNKSAGFYTPQFIMQSKDATSPDAGLWFNIFTSGNTFIKAEGSAVTTLTLEAPGAIYSIVEDDAANAFIWMKGAFASGSTPDSVAILQSSGQLKLIENPSAIASTAGFGQIWVKTATPNELYFTNDAGNDIQITSGSGLAGSGGGDITSVVAGVGLSGGGTSSDVTLTLDMSELTDMTASVNSSEDELIILDNGADRRKLISEIPLSAFNNDSGFITATLTTEQVQDIVGAMLVGTETRIGVTYDDTNGRIDFVVDDMTADTNTTYTGGTNLTLDGTTFNVADAFLINSGDDSTSGTITAGGFDSSGTWTFSGAAGGDVAIQEVHSGTSFTDDDTSLMTAGAIKEKIESYNYTSVTNYVTNNANDTMAGTLTIDKNSTATTNGETFGLKVDYDHTGIVAGGQAVLNYGIESKINTNSPTHVGAVYNFGYKSHLIAGTSGVQENYGYYGVVTGGDQNFGMLLDVDNGGVDYRARSSANLADHFSISTTTNGATTLATVDADAALAHLTLDVDGDITLDADGGDIYFKDNGTLLGTINQGGFVVDVTEYGNGSIMEDGSEVLYFADGKVSLDYSFFIGEQASAQADVAGRGQLWVKSNTPNELYFTTDAGNDIQITDGTSLAGGGGASALNDLSDVTYSSGDLTISGLDKIITSGSFIFEMGADTSFTHTSTTLKNVLTRTDSSSSTHSGFRVDANITGNAGLGTFPQTVGFEVDLDDTGTHNAGSLPFNYGLRANVAGNANGISYGYGAQLTVTGSDNQYGVAIVTDDSAAGFDFFTTSSASSLDYFGIKTIANGATTLSTVDADNTLANLTLDAGGDITLDAASGNIYVKDNGGNYTPGSDYEIATKKYVDDNAGGGGGTDTWSPQWSMRWYTRYDYYYYPSSTYGANHNNWSSNSTSALTSWNDSYNPCIVVPKDMTIKSYHLHGNYGSAQTIVLCIKKGTPSYGSAGNTSLSTLGSEQTLVVGTANIYVKLEETGLSVSLSAGDIIIPTLRRTTTDTSNYYMFEGVLNIIGEYT